MSIYKIKTYVRFVVISIPQLIPNKFMYFETLWEFIGMNNFNLQVVGPLIGSWETFPKVCSEF